MGPPGCGKTTVATLLSRCSDFKLVKISHMIKEEVESGDKWRAKTIMSFTQGFRRLCPNEIVLNLLKEVFYTTCNDSVGYILDGFPIDLDQAKQFEFEITKVFMIIYPTLSLNSFVMRYRPQMTEAELEEAKEKHIERSKLCQNVYRHYEQKTLKCNSLHPIDSILNELVLDLDRYFGYKFRFISDTTKTSNTRNVHYEMRCSASSSPLAQCNIRE
ncbi:adenylate kinase isoenzyme 1-like [Onthophagus taurus]|uniref:adenylate kinase isoenzyme 1-like n=1 Tax=Onthophagus taurus TaxID=166361 RepID=UPI000C205251|nr:adenylate kinase-like [Onthophagus taurus]